jgi:hypothetical protein
MPKEQTRELDHLIDELPPHVQDIFLKLLEKAAEDPATLRQVTTQIKWSSYRGDLPPAEVFGEYEREYPGAGAWLLDRITTQSNKRLDIAQLQAEGQEERANRAQWAGLLVAIIGTAFSAFAHIVTGSWIFPSILAVSAIGGPSTLPILAKALHKYIGKDDESK